MKFKLNFKVGEPTVNGRIYSQEVLERAINEKLEKGMLFLTEKCSIDVKVDLSKVIGQCDSYEITEDKEVFFEIEMIKEKQIDIENLDEFEVSTSGFCGDIIDNVVGEDFKLSSLFLTKEE